MAHEPQTQRLFVVKATAAVDVLDIRNPNAPVKVGEIGASPYGARVNSVDVNNGVVAVAGENAERQQPGEVAFFSTTAGDLEPKGLRFIPATESPNGRALLMVAHEASGSTVVYQVDARYAYLPSTTKE